MEVRKIGGNLEYWSEIEPVLQEFADLLNLNIEVSNPHGNPCEIKTETGKLFIRFWSTPISSDKTKMEQAFGIKLASGQCDALKPTSISTGIPIVDPVSAIIIAEIHEGTLYVLFDLPDNGNSHADLIAGIMQQYLLLHKNPEEKDKILAEQKAAEVERTKQNWLKECSKRFEKTLKGTKDEIVRLENSISNHQKKLVEEIRILDGQRKKLDQLQASNKGLDERYLKEFEKLLTVPHVARVTIDSGKISIFSDRIYVEYDHKKYDIGDFRIEIYTDGANGGVRFFNLTRQVEGYSSWGKCAHPHVKTDGTPCLGNIKEAVPQLLGDYEYSIVAILAIQYLQSVNTDDAAGKYIDQWPVVEKIK